MLDVLTQARVKSEFHTDVVGILRLKQEQAEDRKIEQQKTCGRLQLRHLAARLHKNSGKVYSLTFESWATQQQFSVTTTRRLQLMLYFIKTQSHVVSPGMLSQLFSANMVQKLDGQSVDTIDARAVLSVIQSICLYHHNVTSLVDFRLLCLTGISHTYRKNLSLAQIVQLYVCCYQHVSVREECWRAVVLVWNYTIESACDAFRLQNTYEVNSVMQCIFKCMLDGWNDDTPDDVVDSAGQVRTFSL